MEKKFKKGLVMKVITTVLVVSTILNRNRLNFNISHNFKGDGYKHTIYPPVVKEEQQSNMESSTEENRAIYRRCKQGGDNMYLLIRFS